MWQSKPLPLTSLGSRLLLAPLLVAGSLTLTPALIMAQDNSSAAERWLQHADVAPPFHAPASLATWQAQRGEVRAKLINLLGKLPPRPSPVKVETVSREDRGQFTVEKFQFD